jgi:hypothetical protein
MIYDKAGTPLNEVLQAAAMQVNERRDIERSGRPLNLEKNTQGKPAYLVEKDRIGDAYKVFRAARPEHHAGSGFQQNAIRKTFKQNPPQVVEYLLSMKGATQRKVAAYLGISLGKLQRTARKAA